ncbi:hypothetical protein BREVNS_1217 [Brevinematales bacterium NS]|nr:hypothetical protein BREVNS_1217 [Brevinematales bacterium NS]
MKSSYLFDFRRKSKNLETKQESPLLLYQKKTSKTKGQHLYLKKD